MTDPSPAIQSSSVTWRIIARVLIKAAILLALCNVLFALLKPIDALGTVSLYNVVLPGRERLPYGEDSARSYNLSLFSLPAMFSSHVVAQPKAADEFRVIVIGDSGAWGWLLKNEDTLAAQLTALGLTTPDGRRVVAYNLGYPILALTKDLLILDEALKHQPDLIVWPITLDSLPREKQLFSPLVQHNADRVRRLIEHYDLKLDRTDPRLIDRSFWDETLIGRRRDLADWLRLQTYGFSWAATGVDQYIPDQIKLRQSDFEADASWQSFNEPATLTEDELAFDALAAGVSLAGNVPVLIVNEPMFISAGRNSDLRYNAFYPRWAYDQYRALLDEQAQRHGWHYLDVWNAIAPDEFTDTPVHLTPQGARQFAALLAPALMNVTEKK
jgi:lysophospholipase L1-like esterase